MAFKNPFGKRGKYRPLAWEEENVIAISQEPDDNPKCEENIFSKIFDSVIKPLKEKYKEIKYEENTYLDLHSELEANIIDPRFTNKKPQFFDSCTCCGNIKAVKSTRPVSFSQFPSESGSGDFDNPQNNEKGIFSTGEISVPFKDGEIVTIELLFETTFNCGCS